MDLCDEDVEEFESYTVVDEVLDDNNDDTDDNNVDDAHDDGDHCEEVKPKIEYEAGLLPSQEDFVSTI